MASSYQPPIFNGSAPGANTNIMTSFTPKRQGSALRVTVALTTSSVFNLVITDGTTTHVVGLNESAALNAADLYTFTFAAPAEDSTGAALSYNFQVETDGVIELLAVEEVEADVI